MKYKLFIIKIFFALFCFSNVTTAQKTSNLFDKNFMLNINNIDKNSLLFADKLVAITDSVIYVKQDSLEYAFGYQLTEHRLDLSGFKYIFKVEVDGLEGIILPDSIQELTLLNSNDTVINLKGYKNLQRLTIECADSLKILNLPSGIKELALYSISLAQLDLTQCPDLEKFKYEGAIITEFDLSSNSKLKSIDFSRSSENRNIEWRNKISAIHSKIGKNDVRFYGGGYQNVRYFNKLDSLIIYDFDANKEKLELPQSLVYLEFANSVLKNKLPQLKNLREIVMAVCELRKFDLSNNPSIKKASFYQCEMYPQKFTAISQLKELEYLVVRYEADNAYCFQGSDESECPERRERPEGGITQIDLTNNHKLKYLDCSRNWIKQLDLSNNTELITLNCSMNQIVNLDLQNNQKLEDLDCSINMINTLWLVLNSLKVLTCNTTCAMEKLLIRGCPQLETLNIEGNIGLKTLDLSNNTRLKSFYFFSNSIDTISLENNSALEEMVGSYSYLKLPEKSNLTNVRYWGKNLNSKMMPKLQSLDYSVAVEEGETIDLSNSRELTQLCLSGYHGELDLSENKKLKELELRYCHIDKVLLPQKVMKLTKVDVDFDY